MTSMRALALDMGGSHIGCGVVEGDRLLAHTSISTGDSRRLAHLLPAINKTLHTLLQQTHVKAQACEGIAIGFPGIIDSRSGTICSTLNKYEDALELDLVAWALETFDLPIRIENDARMALLGEHHSGSGRGLDNLVMMTLGTGIGSAAILTGRLLRGVHGHAGCLGGHMVIKFSGRHCLCGNIGCAEAEASGWSLPSVLREWPKFNTSSLSSLEAPGFRELFEYADRGDEVALEVRRHCLQVWAANAVSLIHAYDPEVFIVGGGVMESAALIIPFIQDYVDRHTWASWGKVKLRAAMLGNTAALLGAIPLLTEEIHDTHTEL